MKDLNKVELNAILYYADFISLQESGLPVTDNCKYFFIYGTPINAACIVDNEPIYDENNKYLKRSITEYTEIRNKFGDDGILSFVNNICSLSACGCVSGRDMLRCIYRYGTKKEKQDAIVKYEKYMKNLKYSHKIKNEEGESKRVQCSKYVAHYEQSCEATAEPCLHESEIEINQIES